MVQHTESHDIEGRFSIIVHYGYNGFLFFGDTILVDGTNKAFPLDGDIWQALDSAAQKIITEYGRLKIKPTIGKIYVNFYKKDNSILYIKNEELEGIRKIVSKIPPLILHTQTAMGNHLIKLYVDQMDISLMDKIVLITEKTKIKYIE